MKNTKLSLLIAALLFSSIASAQTSNTGDRTSAAQVDAIYPDIETLYIDLHRNPELAFHEQRTAATLAARLKALGYEVTTGVGGTGIVAILKNGAGPVVMLRTELDALPIEEKTGLPFASTAKTKNDAGEIVPVAHMCGHDLHMARRRCCAMASLRASRNPTTRWACTTSTPCRPA
jgi:metal-dependent amidase/aminoacylase/carboxypeptidase family protein